MNSKRHGEGKIIFPNGTEKYGVWENDHKVRSGE